MGPHRPLLLAVQVVRAVLLGAQVVDYIVVWVTLLALISALEALFKVSPWVRTWDGLVGVLLP